MKTLLRTKRSFYTVLLTALLLSWLMPGLSRTIAAGESFADPAFQKVWERSDKAIADGKASRTWLWGPQPFATRKEAYAEAPGGERLVQFFDKSRMEITNPNSDKTSHWYVTNGLLTVELVTGRMQSGDSSFETRSPSQIPVGGDPDNPGPTYASFARLVSLNGSNRAEQKSGFVSESVDRAGKTAQASATNSSLARYAYYEPNLGHNVPDVFWNWLQKLDEDWVFAMGLPISEPYWAKFVVGGVERDLLVQLFERRVLTYNPANATQWQVEMGNIGQHYYKWRYNSDPVQAGGVTTTPAQNPVTTPTPTGGSASPTPTTAPGATPTPSPAPVPAGLNEEERKFLDLINQYRSANNLPALKIDEKLQQAAHWQSEDMAKNNYFGHIDSKGRDYPKRLTEFGHSATNVNENIATGGQAQATFEIWKNSPGYNAIMLNPEYKSLGIGYASSTSARYQTYWTTDFGNS
jgi:uncharacterized protein YkwD